MLRDSNHVRVLAFALFAGVVVLAGFAYIPSLLRPGIPVSRFPQLPDSVALDLNLRGCNIVRGENVVSVDFGGAGQRDGGILCQQGSQASLLIYLAGSSKPAVPNTHPGGLIEAPENARGIRVVDWNLSRGTTPDSGQPSLQRLASRTKWEWDRQFTAF